MKHLRVSVVLALVLAAVVAWGDGPGLFAHQRIKKRTPDQGLFIKVQVEPPEAHQAGGRWDRLTGRTEDGEEISWGNDPPKMIVHYPGPGTYRLTFRALPDWETPSPVDFTMTGPYNNGKTIAGRYLSPSGTLRVTIMPAELAQAGARWAIDSMDAPWKRSGETMKPVVGTYDLLFDRFDAARWTPPANMRVRITRNQTANVTATFTRK